MATVEEQQKLNEKALEIAEQKKKGKIYYDDIKKAKRLAKHQLDIEKLKGYKIETELDKKLCEYLGRFNLAGVSEKNLRKQGLLRGNTLSITEHQARSFSISYSPTLSGKVASNLNQKVNVSLNETTLRGRVTPFDNIESPIHKSTGSLTKKISQSVTRQTQQKKMKEALALSHSPTLDYFAGLDH